MSQDELEMNKQRVIAAHVAQIMRSFPNRTVEPRFLGVTMAESTLVPARKGRPVILSTLFKGGRAYHSLRNAL